VPGPSPTPPATTSLEVTGVVLGDGQPLGDAYVELWGEHRPRMGSWRIEGRTDVSGRYRLEKNDSGPTRVWVTAIDRQHGFENQPCAVWFDYSPSGRTERIADVSLTASVGPSCAPPTVVAGQRQISGTVYSLTPAGKQPVSGASAYVDISDSVVQARTRTNADGRFLLCGLPVDQPLGIFANLFIAPFQVPQAWVWLTPGGDVDIELTLK
jgi:hypothetical protein